MENYFLPLDGGTVYGNTTFTDNSKLILGTGGVFTNISRI